ncbi:LysM domain-containing protein, partial [Streptomyces sp. JJ36]|uniref:LysM peptidoglycan-binding domain-containing protein n=1 Tax=Streptomyces sp. JJ36 TaxID=2736645 RepID=UPI0023519740
REPAGAPDGTPPPADRPGPAGSRSGGAPRAAAADGYTVVAGDTLSGIAARYAVAGGWRSLYRANRGVVGPDPGLIHPGMRLRLR